MNLNLNREFGKAPIKTNLDEITIDSLKLTFPKNAVQIVDNKFNKEYKKIYIETGEIDEKHINLDKHKVEKIKGISSRIGMGVWQMGQHQNEVMIVQINAKMLREYYFEGIRWDNWRLVYNHIINMGIIYMDEQTFLTGMVTDIDFAKQRIAEPNLFKDFITNVYAKVLPDRHKFVSKPFRQQTNIGIQFNTREKATPTRPFTKFYHKGLELEYKSNEFKINFLADKYEALGGVDYNNFARLEVQLKNSSHKQYHALQDIKDMKNLLDLQAEKDKNKRHQERLSSFFDSAVPKYLHRLDRVKYDDSLTPVDQYISWLFGLLADRGYGKAAFYAGLEIFDDKQKRHRMKKKLERIIDNIPDQELINNNTRIDDLFEQFKIF